MLALPKLRVLNSGGICVPLWAGNELRGDCKSNNTIGTDLALTSVIKIAKYSPPFISHVLLLESICIRGGGVGGGGHLSDLELSDPQTG